MSSTSCVNEETTRRRLHGSKRDCSELSVNSLLVQAGC